MQMTFYVESYAEGIFLALTDIKRTLRQYDLTSSAILHYMRVFMPARSLIQIIIHELCIPWLNLLFIIIMWLLSTKSITLNPNQYLDLSDVIGKHKNDHLFNETDITQLVAWNMNRIEKTTKIWTYFFQHSQ